MKQALLRKILAKMDAVVLSTNAVLTEGNADVTDIPAKQSKSFVKRAASAQRMQWEKMFRKAPDSKFDDVMAAIDEFPSKLHASLKTSIAKMPKNRGGRIPHHPLAARLRAIKEVGQEMTKGYGVSEAVGLVAKRYEMRREYVGRLWRNRRRLLQSELAVSLLQKNRSD